MFLNFSITFSTFKTFLTIHICLIDVDLSQIDIIKRNKRELNRKRNQLNNLNDDSDDFGSDKDELIPLSQIKQTNEDNLGYDVSPVVDEIASSDEETDCDVTTQNQNVNKNDNNQSDKEIIDNEDNNEIKNNDKETELSDDSDMVQGEGLTPFDDTTETGSDWTELPLDDLITHSIAVAKNLITTKKYRDFSTKNVCNIFPSTIYLLVYTCVNAVTVTTLTQIYFASIITFT